MPQQPKQRWVRGAQSHSGGLYLLCWFLGTVLVTFLVVPLIALALSQSGQSLANVARMGDVRDAIALSLEGAFLSAAVAVLLGVPLAYGLARSTFPGKSVGCFGRSAARCPAHRSGIALLMVLGRRGVLGEPLQALVGLKFWGTLGGVVAAMVFVSAPYTVNAARIGFEAVDPRLEKIARTLGLGPWQTFARITLPLAWRSIMTGVTLTYARSISEFGAVVILAYYPMTAPVKICSCSCNSVSTRRQVRRSCCWPFRSLCSLFCARSRALRRGGRTDGSWTCGRGAPLTLGDFRLRSVDLAVSRGEILVILGPDGSGKSVTLETIAGFHRPDSGRVIIGGRDVTRLVPERRNVAFVVQNFGLFPHLNVAQNVAIARRAGRKGIEIDKTVGRSTRQCRGCLPMWAPRTWPIAGRKI